MSSPIAPRHNPEVDTTPYRTTAAPESPKVVERVGRKALQHSATGMSNDLRKFVGKSTQQALQDLEESNN